MKKKIIFGIVALAVIGSGVGIYLRNQNKALEVNSTMVVRGDIAEYVEELGVVKVNNHETIYSPTAGKVTEVLVDIGDDVKAGDVLLKLDGEHLSSQIAELDAQRSAILAQFNEAKKPVDSNSIEKMELEISNIEKRIVTAEETANNKKMLYDAGAISNEEYQNSLRSLEAENSNLAKAMLDLQQLNIPVSQNILAQYEAQLKQLKIQKQALVDSGEDFVISASMDGIVLKKEVEQGSFLQTGMFIMEVGDVGELYIESEVLVGDIANVEEGSKVRISSKDLEIVDLEGIVTRIHPIAFSKVSDLGIEQKRIKVDIEIRDLEVDLRPGYDLDIKIIIDSKENTLLIPESAVFIMDDKSYVFVNEQDRAVLKEVETGIESERQIEVITGLEEGKIVILSPDSDLEEGMSIKSNIQ